jgi:hypothetical protein
VPTTDQLRSIIEYLGMYGLVRLASGGYDARSFRGGCWGCDYGVSSVGTTFSSLTAKCRQLRQSRRSSKRRKRDGRCVEEAGGGQFPAAAGGGLEQWES